MPKFHARAEIFDVTGMAYGRLRFECRLPHGKRHRHIEVEIGADQLLRLAECIRGCHKVYEDPRTGARPASLEEAHNDPRFEPSWIGHAVWHLKHPEELMPCLPDNTTIIDTGLREALKETPASSGKVLQAFNKERGHK